MEKRLRIYRYSSAMLQRSLRGWQFFGEWPEDAEITEMRIDGGVLEVKVSSGQFPIVPEAARIPTKDFI